LDHLTKVKINLKLKIKICEESKGVRPLGKAQVSKGEKPN